MAQEPEVQRAGWLDAWRRRGRMDDERLRGAIADFTVQRHGRGDLEASWATRTDLYLEQAETHQKAGRVNAAWSSLKAAQRELVGAFDETELLIEADHLRREATDKLTGWRLAAVTDALDGTWKRLGDEAKLRQAVTSALDAPELRPGSATEEALRHRIAYAIAHQPERDKESELEEVRLRLKEARHVLDEHQDNVYWKIGLLRRQVQGAALMLIAVLIVTLITLGLGWSLSGDAALLSDWRAVTVVMVLGALGAAVSGVLTPLSRDRNQLIPDATAQGILVWVRPFIGAGAAVIVVAILQSGIAGLSVASGAAPVAALAAGFSERLVGQSVAMASAALGK